MLHSSFQSIISSWFKVVLVWVAFATPAFTQTFGGRTISEIEIRYIGPKNVSEGRLRNYIGSKVGREFSLQQIDEDVKRLYESGLVDDARFLAEESGAKVKLIAEVTTRAGLGGVGFAGNTVFSDKKLSATTDLSTGGSLTDAKVLTARRNIEKLYRDYGYSDISISHRRQPSPRKGYEDLVFVVNEGSKNEIRKIKFEGNRSIAGVDLRREIDTKQKGFFSFFTKSGKLDGNTLDDDFDKLLDYYRSKGFLRARVVDVRREPSKKEMIDLVIVINEGQKYTVNQVSFGKMSVFNPQELTPALSLIGGMPYSSKKVRADIKNVRSYYGAKGYADAQVREVVTELPGGRINLKYEIQEGSRYRVGRVNIQGNVKTQDRVIRREVPLKPNDYFNSVDLETTKRRLQNINYFDSVNVIGSSSNRSGYRDIDIRVAEKRTGSLSFGAGLSSIDNIVGFINLEQSNFDIRNPWSFQGGGQRFNANLRLGAERQDVLVSLTEPWFLGRRLSLGGELYYQQRNFLSDIYDQQNVGGAISLRKPLGKRSSLKLEYRLEKVDVELESGIGAGSLFQTQDIEGDFLSSGLTLSYQYDSRDSNVLPRKGHRFSAELGYNGGALGGDVDTISLDLNGTKHWQLPLDMVLNLKGSLGSVDNLGDGSTPVFERKFLGGSRDLRGFEFRDIGPRDNAALAGVDATDEVIGGGTYGFISAEVSFPLFESVRGAAFLDTGFVNDGSWEFAPDDLYSDAGLGLRLNLPIGPIAVDYAIPLSSPDEEADKGGQFNFYMNYQF